MYTFSSIFSFFKNFKQPKAEVLEQPKSTFTRFTHTKRNHGGYGSNDEWGRPTINEQKQVHDFNNDKDGDGLPDVFVRPKREPSLVRNYTDTLRNTNINDKYKNTRAYQEAYAGYSTGTIFSSGVSRLGQLTGLFNNAINDPFGSYNQQRSSYWS